MLEDKYLIKKIFLIYFILLITEGGLRRWVLPGIATPLLIIRDPFAFYIIFLAFKNSLIPKNIWLQIILIVAIISFYTALIFGHGNILVALFGIRILLLHFPLVIIMGYILEKSDIINFGKIILWISIPMCILITIQFYSPQTAWVNKGVGFSKDGAGFGGTADYFRPPGTFSFITGVTSFFSLASVFVFYFWIKIQEVNKALLIISTFAILIAIPTSISRTLLLFNSINFIIFILIKLKQPNFLKNFVQLIFGIIFIFILLINSNKFNTQINAFTDRFTSANEIETNSTIVSSNSILINIYKRFIYSTFQKFDNDKSLFGYGIGAGSNVGAQLLTGNVGITVAEGEIAREIGECGLILGLIIVFIRIHMTYKFTNLSFELYKLGDSLPIMFTGIGAIYLFQGGWAQPNDLGFYVIIGTFWNTSLKNFNTLS